MVVVAVADPFGTDYPSEWDPRAAGFTAFVEQAAGHDYDHPVEVRFLAEEDFVELVAADPDELSDDDRAAYADSEAQGRALGLFSGSTDVFAEQDTLSTEGILAYYSPDDHEVVVRLPEGVQPDDVTSGDDLPVDVQVTLVHELTHVLQDQVYDLAGIQDDAETPEAYSAALGLVEGHAEWVAQRFVRDELTPEQQDEYYGDQDNQTGDYEEATSDVTPVLSAAQSAPYALGPAFVGAVAEGGIGQVDDAFDDPPTTERQLMQPVVYLDGEDTPDLDEPALPDGAEEVDGGTLGATTLYFILSLGLDPHDALRAVDGATADRYLAFEQDDTVCVDIAVAASAEGDAADLVEQGLKAWAAARPEEAEATVDPRRHDVRRAHLRPGCRHRTGRPWRTGDRPALRTSRRPQLPARRRLRARRRGVPHQRPLLRVHARRHHRRRRRRERPHRGADEHLLVSDVEARGSDASPARRRQTSALGTSAHTCVMATLNAKARVER